MKEKITSTENYVFDTDCLSTFLYVNCENILCKLFDKIIIPQKVYKELCEYRSKDSTSIFKNQLIKLKDLKFLFIHELDMESDEAQHYFDLTLGSKMKGIKIIGDGEAACIAFVIANNGVICSNNLSDIMFYVDKYKLKYLTSADLFCVIYEKQLLSWQEIENYWEKIKKHSKLPTNTFIEYFQNKK